MLIPFCCVDGGPQSEPGSFIRGKLCMVYTLLILMCWCVGSPHESSYGHIHVNSLQPVEQRGNLQCYYKFIFLLFIVRSN